MRVPFVDLKAQYLTIKNEIDQAIQKVLSDTSFVGGPLVKQFERDFAALLGVTHCVGVGNGTDAIFITLKMLNIGPGDEVITVANSWISTSETISQTGARPVFVDIDPETFTIDVKLIESKITAKTKAIIPVHLYGQAAHIREIKKICDKHRLFLVEDCAHSHLTEDAEQYVGTFGTAATFSFYPSKNLGAYGDGGAIVTNDDALAERIRMYADHGALSKHKHKIEGINSRLDTIQAAILSVKLPHLKSWTAMRNENAARYNKSLTGVKGIFTPAIRSNTRHSFHLYVIRTSRRDALMQHLESRGVTTGIHYPAALPNLEAYKYLGHTFNDFPVASQYQDEILSLPMYAELSEVQIEHVCDSVKDFFKS